MTVSLALSSFGDVSNCLRVQHSGCFPPRDLSLHSCWLTGMYRNDTHVLPLPRPGGALGPGIFQCCQQWGHPSIIADLECLEGFRKLVYWSASTLTSPWGLLFQEISSSFSHICTWCCYSMRETMCLGQKNSSWKSCPPECTIIHWWKIHFLDFFYAIGYLLRFTYPISEVCSFEMWVIWSWQVKETKVPILGEAEKRNGQEETTRGQWLW